VSATVEIRLALASDAEAIAEIYRPVVEETVISFEVVPPDAAEMARRIGETQPAHPWLVCEIGGRLAGYAYGAAHRTRAAYRWSVDASVYVSSAHRRRGVARGLYVSLFGILASQGYVTAYAGITLPNAASVALHESLGFERLVVYPGVGYKLGRWHDVGWWRLVLNAQETPPREPRDLTSVRTSPGWAALLARGEPLVRASR
jgi:phosphinothricin acetyltransferase